MWKWWKKPEPLVVVIGTSVTARTKSGAYVRGIVKSIRMDHSQIGVLIAGAADTPNNLLWFKGEDLALDTSAWKD